MNNIQYDKPFCPYTDLLEKLRKKNIIVNNETFAIDSLSNFSYYTLVNGYKDIFPYDETQGRFLEPVSFEVLFTLHIIDVSLNNLILKNILYIENSLKSKISYHIAEKYGVYTDYRDLSNRNPNDYLYQRNYSPSNNKRYGVLNSLKKSITNPNRNAIMQHYINTKNHIPPWILTTNITFGLTIEWYSIFKKNDKSYICNQFIHNTNLSDEDTKEFMKKALDLLREYRNAIAHGNRTFSDHRKSIIPKKQLLALAPNYISETEYNSGLGQKDLYSVILLFVLLLNDQYLIANFFLDLKNILNPYNETTFSDKTIFEAFHLPNDLFKRFDQLSN